MHAYDDAIVSITGGTVNEDVEAENNSMSFIREGVFGVDNTLDSGFVVFSNEMTDNATIIILGSNFSVRGTPVDPEVISASSGRLTGTLASGSALDISFLQEDAGQIKLVTVP